MKKILLTLFAFVSLNAMGQVKTWDFTTLSDADKELLDADVEAATWWKSADQTVGTLATTRYSNISEIAKDTPAFALSANGSKLSITDGLTFCRTDSKKISSGSVRIDAGARFVMNGANICTYISDEYAQSGRTAVITCASSNGDSRTLTFTGATVTSLTVAGEANTENMTESTVTFTTTDTYVIKLSITANQVTISQSNGIYFFTIVIDDAATALETVEAAEVDENAPIYNLLGQKVQKGTKGILIQNGKKFIQK